MTDDNFGNTALEHAARVIDPGNEPSTFKPKNLGSLIQWLERHPGATLTGGEGFALVQEIHRLESKVASLELALDYYKALYQQAKNTASGLAQKQEPPQE